MRFHLPVLTTAAILLTGCSALETPGSAQYFSNQPGGLPIFRVGSGLGGPTLAVQQPDGKWSKPHGMKPVEPDQPPAQ